MSFFDKVEDNTAVRSEKRQQEKGDNFSEEYISELWDFTHTSLFYREHDDLPYLLDVKLDNHLFRTRVQYSNPAYNCFLFWESRPGAHRRRVHHFAPLLKGFDCSTSGDEKKGRRLRIEYLWVGYLPQSTTVTRLDLSSRDLCDFRRSVRPNSPKSAFTQ
ncbi:hypothetical protein Golob_024421, partial [Gossypium lobatum]|nr:hypothetical protein [Gossypium lobatum]